MIVDLRKRDQNHSDFEFSIAPEFVDLNERNAKLSKPAEASFKVVSDGWLFLVSGVVSCSFFRNCDRCFKRDEIHLEIEIEDNYVIVSDLNPDREIELESKDLPYSVLKTRELDLAGVFADKFLTEVPDIYVCEDECPGLCDNCRKRLSDGECQCEDDNIDPRWSALKALK